MMGVAAAVVVVEVVELVVVEVVVVDLAECLNLFPSSSK